MKTQPPSPPTTSCRTRYDKDEVCVPPFNAVPNVGCVYLKEALTTWDDARTCCQAIGGDLYSLGTLSDYTALQNYLGNLTQNEVWVGVKSRKWLNGNDVTASEWSPGVPNDAIDCCARMVKRVGYPHLLDDITCANTYFVLCQLPDP
ncbi:C-type lectin domain family 17, member A-like [Procambarus clarkii]|uniref:C-type lectin domain family 17, member A-like n=1 Tax=Procambarus clarkii TaxID=6728 RepID=UPI00374302F5